MLFEVCDFSCESFLECGSLLPLFSGELARRSESHAPGHGQQAGLDESGSKLPHSRASHVRLCSNFDDVGIERARAIALKIQGDEGESQRLEDLDKPVCHFRVQRAR